MAATKNQYDVSQVLVRRGQEQFANKDDSDEKKESDRFFYWLMEQMGKEAEVFCWGRHAYEISLATRMYHGNRIEVYHKGRYHTDKYEPNKRLTKEQFFEVMKEVEGIIKTLPNFTASYVHHEGLGNARLYVTMMIPLDENSKTQFVAQN